MVKNKIEEVIKKVATAELGAIEAFVQLAQGIQRDESLSAFLKKEKFWRFELGSLDTIMKMPKKERMIFLRNFIFKEKKKDLTKIVLNQHFQKLMKLLCLVYVCRALVHFMDLK